MPKIIIADDQEDVREPYARFIRKLYDTEVDEVSNGGDLVDRVRYGGYSLILTDNKMPVMDGLGAVREIRKFDPTTPIYMLSSSQVDDLALELGVTGYIDKMAIARQGFRNILGPMLDRHLKRRPPTV